MSLAQTEEEEEEVGAHSTPPELSPTPTICLFMFLASLNTVKMKDGKDKNENLTSSTQIWDSV